MGNHKFTSKEEILEKFFRYKVVHPPHVEEVINEGVKLREEYKAKFGKHSLDRVILAVYEGEDSLPALKWCNQDLREAIDNNEPLYQVPPEIWKTILF